MKRGLLTLVTAAIAFRTATWRSDKRQEARDKKVVNRQASAYPGCESFPRRSEYSNPPPDPVAILTCPLLPPIDIFLYTLTVTSFHLIQPHVPD